MIAWLAKESSFRGENACLVWFKMIEALNKETGITDAELRPACLDPVHRWLDQLARPSYCPDVAGFSWNPDAVT